MEEYLTLVFDNETTGLPLHAAAPLSKQPKCIEFGAVLLNESGAIVDEYNQLIDPGEPLEAVITKITGLTDADLRGQPAFLDALLPISKLFSVSTRAIAHNMAFDRSIIEFELARLAPPGERDGFVRSFPWPPVMLCTVEATMAEWGRRPKMLELYAATLGRPLAQTHRALDDARALAEIVVALNLHKRPDAARWRG